MRLPIPDARDAVTLLGQARSLVAEAAGVLPRVLVLVGQAESLLVRVNALIDRIETTRQSADAVVERTDAVVTDANALIVRTAGTVASVEPTIDRAQHLLDSFAPSLELLKPTLDRLAKSTSPEEVEAVVRLIDHLPDLVDKMIVDVLPIVENMKTVAPDIHDMLDTIQELNEMIAKIPGMGRIRQRVEDKQAAED